MDCPECGTDMVVFSVPTDCREYAPDSAHTVGVCPACLALHPAEASNVPPDFSRILDGFPDGDAGGAMALALALLSDSVTLNRSEIEALFDFVADAGVDPWLVTERAAVSPTVAPDEDLERARQQLEQLG